MCCCALHQRLSKCVTHALPAILGLALVSAPAAAQELAAATAAQLEAVRAALEKYQDPVVAVYDGYLSTLACTAYSDGGMGVHFINMGTLGPEVDPARPQVLIYEPVGDELKLVAAEWFVPLATGVKERPQLFGYPFDGPMPGHEPLMPEALEHYDLHVWLWKDNPAGMFNSTNPAVTCDGQFYAYLDEKPAHASHPKHAH